MCNGRPRSAVVLLLYYLLHGVPTLLARRVLTVVDKKRKEKKKKEKKRKMKEVRVSVECCESAPLSVRPLTAGCRDPLTRADRSVGGYWSACCGLRPLLSTISQARASCTEYQLLLLILLYRFVRHGCIMYNGPMVASVAYLTAIKNGYFTSYDTILLYHAGTAALKNESCHCGYDTVVVVPVFVFFS